MKKSASPPDHANSIFPLIPNDVVKIDTPATENRCLIVAEIRQLSGLNRPLVDYFLVRNPPGTPPLLLRVLADQGAKGIVTHRLLLLTLYDSLSFNEGLFTVVQDDTKRLVIGDGIDPKEAVHDEFWRVNDKGGSEVCRVVVRSHAEEPKETHIEFWDYSRLIDVDGVETEEFIFVEMNKATGWFEIWRGIEVAPGKIAVL